MTRNTTHAHSQEIAEPILPGLLDPGRKGFRDGAHRLVDPAATLARIRPFLPEMGITRIANITGLDRIGVPVALAFRPNSRNLAVAQGKGISVEAAQVSAVMESVEHYHAESVTLPLRYASYDDLRDACRLIEPDDLPLAAEGTFHPRLQMLWIEGYDLQRRESLWLPYELVNTNFTLPFPPGHGCFQANSNGLASGNDVLEAISQAICEAVERDALALWHLAVDQTRDDARVRLDSIDDEHGRELLDRFRTAGLDVTIWDITTDVGIPSFRCMIAERGNASLHVGYTAQGMGCHPSRAVALVRAMTEAAQSRLTYIAGSRDDVFRDMYMRLRDPDRAERRRRQLRPGDGRREFPSIPDWDADTFHADVVWELERLRAVGIERAVIVVLTKPQFGIPVVKIVVPGLEGFVFDRQYTPGRRARRAQELG